VSEISETIYNFILEEEDLRTLITSIGLPILIPDGSKIIRGPRINIPENIYHGVEIEDGDIERWANKGWIDLRPKNFVVWQNRFQRMQRTRHTLHTRGTSSVTMKTYLPDGIEIGAVVAWLFNNDKQGYRLK